MREEIFTTINKQNQPVDIQTLSALEEEIVTENLIRNYINEIILESSVKFSGILKVMPSDRVISEIDSLLVELPPNAIPISRERWHVTLIHQSILKPFRKELKELQKTNSFPEPPEIIIDPVLSHRAGLEKQSWVVWVQNQSELASYVNRVMEMLGGPINPEPSRVFHISVANLTGKPGDSVR